LTACALMHLFHGHDHRSHPGARSAPSTGGGNDP
jgi:hypothetical protein